MLKKELIEDLSGRAGFSKQEVERFHDALWDVLAERLERGEPVFAAGFGKFETHERAARTGRNPQTGENIEIPASRAVRFKPSATLKRRIN